MRGLVLMIIPKDDAKKVDDVRKRVYSMLEDIDEEYFEQCGIPQIYRWRLGGRFAVDCPDAEDSPELYPIDELQDVTGAIGWFARPAGCSLFEKRCVVPVQEVTDDHMKRARAVILYRTITEREHEKVTGLSAAQKLRSLFAEDFAVVVEADFTYRSDGYDGG